MKTIIKKSTYLVTYKIVYHYSFSNYQVFFMSNLENGTEIKECEKEKVDS